MNHLLFHKSLIDEQRDVAQINQYLEMAKQAATGEHLVMENMFDRSVYLALDLVVSHGFNPWNIDLVQFSSLYLNHARKEKIELFTAGRIIYLAWRVLRMQSDSLVENMEAKQIPQEQGLDWDDLPMGAWMDVEDGYSYTNLVMNRPDPPLQQPLRRDAKRKVMLIELLDAFSKARKEAEEYQLLRRLRHQERLRQSALAQKSMKGAAHEDHIEEDIAAVWKQIQALPDKKIALSSLYKQDDEQDHVRFFLSVLFLAYEQKITIRQQKFPYGKIYITKC